MMWIFPLGREAIKSGSQSNRRKILVGSGCRRVSSKLGLEKINSMRLWGVMVVCCHSRVERHWRKRDSAVNMERKCGPDIER